LGPNHAIFLQDAYAANRHGPALARRFALKGISMHDLHNSRQEDASNIVGPKTSI